MSFKPFHKLIKKNIEFHNDQRDALDVEIKEPHHRDQRATSQRSNLYGQSNLL